MNLTGLTTVLRQSRAYQQHLSLLQGDGTSQATTFNVMRSARPYLLSALAQDWDAPIILLTAKVKRAYNIAEQLPVWLGDDRDIFRFAEPAPGFYERAPWGESAIRARIQTLAALLPPEDAPSPMQPIVVASARAWMQRTLPVNQFRRGTLVLRPGQRQDINRLIEQWLRLGYEPSNMVTEQGTFSRRGGLLDIFPPTMDAPVRIEFFDDEIDTLRLFDISTQRTINLLNHAVITPAREALPENAPPLAWYLAPWFQAEGTSADVVKDLQLLGDGVPFPHLEHYLPYLYPNPVSLFDYAPQDALIVIEDPDELRESFAEIEKHAEAAREEHIKAGRLAPDHPKPYLSWEMLETALGDRRVLNLHITGETFNGVFSPVQRFGGQLKPALSYVRTIRKGESGGASAIVISQQIARLTELWREQDTYVSTVQDVIERPEPGSLALVNGTLTEGWSFNSETPLHVITDAELFGWNRPEPRRRKASRPARVPESNYADWREGEYVVHVDYGIGRFVEMRHRVIDGTEREYLVVEYGGNDTVFVPIHQADRLNRYVGVDDKPPTLSKLGQPDWSRVKSKAKKAVEEEARELLALYAERAKTTGHAYSEDDHWQRELEASFPYVETEDQLRAVREVKIDMEREMPMDRLICGDVGFGKTEVALRAAFKAINDGKQVAVLVPTTILAQQHYETFRNRLAQFPVKIEMMSRFRTKEEQESVLPRVSNGEIDIMVGTHRILSEDVTFKDLGLVIIDEEQRFGVKQKEHFKQLRTQVDVLTLTATPIPRTMYMSLTGVRDISMIQTPPEERMSIITHVGGFDDQLVRQAVLRELERGGQIFVVHNRIRSIDHLREKLEEIVPEARIVTAHGQMHARQLENVMAAFARGEFDILLSTSIIENGIDIPNANTLIVDRADWFGLAQLYQLRGRVGRGAQQAYAYFFSVGKLTEEARARLETLAENTGLGAGFQIAMRDLEIRGAGDILSTKQTGHAAAVGLNLYTQLLSQAVQELRSEGKSDQTATVQKASVSDSSVILNLPVPAYIPDDWIDDIALRLQLYRRIANLNTRDEVETMRDELRDRFGPLPLAVEGLLYQIHVKVLAQQISASAIITRDDVIQIKLPFLVELDRPALAQQLGRDVTVTRVAVEFPLGDPTTWRERLIAIMEQLAQGVAVGVGM